MADEILQSIGAICGITSLILWLITAYCYDKGYFKRKSIKKNSWLFRNQKKALK